MLPRPLRDEEREKGANALGTMVRLHILIDRLQCVLRSKRNAKESKNIQAGGAVFSWTGSLYILFGLVIPI